MREPFSSVKKLGPFVEENCKEKRGPWTAEEDELLSSYIKREGEGGWRTLPKKAGLLRCGKSCRLRWMNYLRPSLKRGHISPDEQDLILRLHRLLGNRWSLIAGRIPGRTDNEIKNYWNTHMSKKLISLGIDPRTHKPLSTTSSSINPNHNNKHSLSSSKPVAIISNPHENTSNPNTNNVLAPPSLVSIDMENDQMNQPNNEFNHEEDDDIVHNYDSPDDIFSSFLDSLINEEMCDEEQNLVFEPNHKDQEAKVDKSNDPNVDKKLY